MLGYACCLRRRPQKDLLEDRPTPPAEPDQIGDKPPEPDQVDQTRGQASTSLTLEQETPDEEPRKNIIERILKYLESVNLGKVVVYGKHGIGKTWIAKEVTKQALTKKSFDFIIWVYNRQIRCSSVFHQIAIQENLVGADYNLGDDGATEEIIIESLRHRLTGRKVLLVFDNNDDGLEKTKENPFLQLEKILINADNSSKVLITTPNINEVMMTCYDTNCQAEAVEIKPLTPVESRDLLTRYWDTNKIQPQTEVDLDDIVKRCRYLPAAIVFTNTVLLYALKHAPDYIFQEMAIKEAKKEINSFWMLGCSSGFEKFRNNITIIKCLWLSYDYLRGHTSMNYNKLILFWMLDGCFDNTTSLEKAYAEGHKVVIDFLNAGLLGGREAGDIVLERAGLEFAEFLFHQFTRERFQFEKSCKFYDLSVSGKVKRMNSSIGFFTKSGEGNSDNIDLGILLLKRDDDISKANEIKLEGLYVTKSIQILLASLVKPIVSFQQMCPFISVLILKDCHSLSHNNISDIANLTHLMVLEISGCSSLREIPEDFFANFELLESLNLSANPFKKFPRLSFGLNNLRSLVLRRCHELESFPDVNGLAELRLLDVFGSKFNSWNSKDWYLEELPELRVLDLSETDIYDCPELRSLVKLKMLFLNNCPHLKNLGLLTSLSELEVVEASGSIKLVDLGELNNVKFSMCKLDLSNTKLSKLPPLKKAIDLAYLFLKGCSQLKELPPIEGAINLRILDVSDAIHLEKINISFEEMESLQELYFSNTNIRTLPSLTGLKSLRKLMLDGCKALQTLPQLDLLTSLLILDLQGCITLEGGSDLQLCHDTLVLRG